MPRPRGDAALFRFRFLPRLIHRLQIEPALPLGSPGGVRLRVHPSAAFAAAVAVLSIRRGMLGDVPDAVAALAVAGLLAAALAFSLVVRAICAGRASRNGSPVVTVHLLGASLDADEPESPREDALRAASGLVASLVLALAGAAGWFAAAGRPGLGPAAIAGAFLCITNTLVLSIHAFPAFPLDSGRFLRAALWRVGGDRNRATWLAARNSRWFALAMLATGVALLLWGAGVGALLLLVGWFVGESAEGYRASSRAALVRELASSGAPISAGVPSGRLGPERAGSRHAKNPSAASTRRPGTLASVPKDPPVQDGDPTD